jgi:DTW domain-containing protein YfiP
MKPTDDIEAIAEALDACGAEWRRLAVGKQLTHLLTNPSDPETMRYLVIPAAYEAGVLVVSYPKEVRLYFVDRVWRG